MLLLIKLDDGDKGNGRRQRDLVTDLCVLLTVALPWIVMIWILWPHAWPTKNAGPGR